MVMRMDIAMKETITEMLTGTAMMVSSRVFKKTIAGIPN